MKNLLVALTARSSSTPYTPLDRSFSRHAYAKPPAGNRWSKSMQGLRARERARQGRLVTYQELLDEFAGIFDRFEQCAEALAAAAERLRPILVTKQLTLFGRQYAGREYEEIRATTFMDPDTRVTWEDTISRGPLDRLFEDVRGLTPDVLSHFPPEGSLDPETKLAVTGSQQSQPRRQVYGLNYETTDMPLVAEMHHLVKSGKARSPWNAAVAVSDRAQGYGGPISKAKRLLGRYRSEQFRAEHD
jgi:hypothetical protein